MIAAPLIVGLSDRDHVKCAQRWLERAAVDGRSDGPSQVQRSQVHLGVEVITPRQLARNEMGEFGWRGPLEVVMGTSTPSQPLGRFLVEA